MECTGSSSLPERGILSNISYLFRGCKLNDKRCRQSSLHESEREGCGTHQYLIFNRDVPKRLQSRALFNYRKSLLYRIFDQINIIIEK